MRNKLQPSGRKAIMVGYSRERKTYRLFDVESRSIIEERNVIFIENQKDSYNLKEKNENESYDWNIEDLLDTSNNNNLNYENKTHNEINPEEQEINKENIPDNENEHLQDKVDNQDQDVEKRVHIENRKIGRPKGLTAEESKKRKEETLKENEDRLKEIGVRRSARLNRQDVQIAENIQLPHSIVEARDSKEWEEWKRAMENELESLDKHNIWYICERPRNVKIIKSKWIFSNKRDDNDKIKYKARLVVAGYQQVKNHDYDESYSPVISIDAWRTLIAIAAKKNLNIRFFDVKTAYLHGELKETIYLELPPGFENRFGKQNVCKLKKSLYGLPQSGRNWYYKLKEVLLKNNLKQLASENCVFTNSDETCFFVFSSYVDDFTILDNDNKTCERILNSLRNEFEIRETTQSNSFLGIEIENNSAGIYLS